MATPTKKPKSKIAVDAVMLEAWRIKDELARKFDFNIHRIAEDLRAQQALSGKKIVTRPQKSLLKQKKT